MTATRGDDSSPPSDRKHVCVTCQRKFNRREHLLRHERIHTEEMPFQCEACDQRFRRQDVYRRHLARQCRANPRTAAAASQHRSRASQACNQCRSLKLKCNGLSPCQRCTAKDRLCSYYSRSSVQNPLSPASVCASPETDNMIGTLRQQPLTAATELSASPGDTVTSIAETLDAARVLQNTGQQGFEASGRSAGQGPFLDPVSAAVMSNQPPMHSLLEPSPWNLVPVPQDLSVGPLPQDAFGFSLDGTSWDASHQDFYPYFLSVDTDLSLAPDMSIDHFGAMDLPQNGDLLSADSSRFPDTGTRSSYRGNVPLWLDCMPLTIQHHDTHIVDAFIDKFTNSISRSFPTFQDVRIVEQTLPDLILAMAAVGGLFSDLPGSFRIAMSLYTDARRLANGRLIKYLHAQIWSEEELDPQQLADLIRALLSIELFGLYSGDARSMECSEAFHRQLLQVVQDSGLLNLSHLVSREDSDIKMRLLVSFLTLESYHFVLLQRPPCVHGITFLPKALLNHMVMEDSQDSEPSYPHDSSLSLLRTTLNPHLTFNPPQTLIGSMFCLVSLTCLTWHARPRRDRYRSTPSTWRREHVELALHRWFNLTSHDDGAVDTSMRILFHMTLLNLYADMNLVHRIASSYFGESKINPKTRQDLQMWADSQDGQAAVLEATALLETAKMSLVFQNRFEIGHESTGAVEKGEATAHSGREAAIPESPHLAASIYSAALLLWITYRACGDPAAGLMHLESGLHSLSRLSSRMARRLCGNLVRLRSSASQD